jgi:hypothetical protein
MICLPLEQREKPVGELEKCCEKGGHHNWSIPGNSGKTPGGCRNELASTLHFFVEQTAGILF